MSKERPPYAEELDELEKDILQYLLAHQKDFPPGTIVNFSPLGLMPNSAGHRDKKIAIVLLREDIRRAHEIGLPEDLIRHSIEQALECRRLIFGNSKENEIAPDEL